MCTIYKLYHLHCGGVIDDNVDNCKCYHHSIRYLKRIVEVTKMKIILSQGSDFQQFELLDDDSITAVKLLIYQLQQLEQLKK